MKVSDYVKCELFPCGDVQHSGYAVPGLELDPSRVRVVLISEAAPPDSKDNYYAGGGALYERTTVQAFQEAGAPVASFEDILGLGVYLTNAVKCAKTGYGIQTATIHECSHLLEQELDLFPDVRAYLLMGDVAIKALNAIAKRTAQPRPIPAGPTYKIRGGEFYFRGGRCFPSYLQAGPSYGIEKSKQRMIAEDIAAALAVAEYGG